MEGVHTGSARTLLLRPVGRAALVGPFQVRSLSHREAVAEKLRAALCRRTVAIRDFFDIDHAVRAAGFEPFQPRLLALLRRKLDVPGTSQPDVSPNRFRQLRQQLDAELRPVLRRLDFEQFDLERAFDCVSRVANLLAP